MHLKSIAIRRLPLVLLSFGIVSGLGLLLYCVYCAYTHFKFTLLDYGVYTNMMWNCAHLDGFRMMVVRNYLYTHLSFSLSLIGLFFYVWDDAFMPALVQWVGLLAGALILYMFGRRHKVAHVHLLAILFFCVWYRFTQSVILSEFHTVGLYFFVIPCLYVCLHEKRVLAWLPLLFLLGIREDAFLFVLPLLLYFAVRYRWRQAYLMTGVAVLYGLLALFVIYPAINDVSLFARRAGYLKNVDGFCFGFTSFLNTRRQQALFLWLLPCIPFIGKRIWPLFVFTSVALISALLSGHPSQQGLGGIYSAPVMVMMTVAMMEIWVSTISFGSIRSVFLILVVIAVHLYSGFLPGGGKASAIYSVMAPEGRYAIAASKHIPKQGILLTEIPLAGFCGNRKDLVAGSHYRRDLYAYDLVFCRVSMVRSMAEGDVWRELKTGELGVRYNDGEHLIAQRGYPAEDNEAFIEMYPFREIWVQGTASHGGVNQFSHENGPFRYWEGDGSRGPINLSFGGHRQLKPGRYKALLEYKAETPERTVRDSWGRFGVYELNASKALVEMEIPKIVTGALWNKMEVPFRCSQNTPAELRVTGCDAPLTLRRMWIVPVGED